MLRVLSFCAVIFTGLMFFSPTLERWGLYPFDPSHVSPASVALSSVREESIEIDGDALVIWAARAQRGKPVIFYLHGNAGNLATRAGRFQRFLDRGYGLMALAYPGSSGSAGTPSEATLIKAASATYLAVHQEQFDLRRDPQIILYGESLGAAVATALLDQLQAQDLPTPRAVIFEAPFLSLKALAQHHLPPLADLTGYLRDSWNTEGRAKTALTLPLLVIHGDQDTLVPVDQGKRLVELAPSHDKRFYEVKGGGHTDLWRSDTLPVIWKFIDQNS